MPYLEFVLSVEQQLKDSVIYDTQQSVDIG